MRNVYDNIVNNIVRVVQIAKKEKKQIKIITLEDRIYLDHIDGGLFLGDYLNIRNVFLTKKV